MFRICSSIVAIVFILFSTACQNPSGGESRAEDSAKGSLTVRFANPVGATAKSVLDQGHSQALADCYELVAAGSAHFFTVSVQADQTSAIALDPDDYRIVLLAGDRRSSTATTAVLVGSAYSDQPVTITAGQHSEVSLVVRPVDFSWDVPAQVESGQSFEIQASGDSRNPYVGMSIDGTASTEHPRSKSVAFWNAYHDFDAVTGTQNVWNARLSLTAPTNSTVPLDFQFHGTYINLVDCGSSSGSLYRKTVYTWKWLNRYDLADTDPLVPLVEKQTQIAESQTGLALGIVWE